MLEGQFKPYQRIQFEDDLPFVGGGVTTFTLFGTPATGNDTSIEISAIGTLAANDLCLIWNVADGGGADPPDDTPSGFTKLRTALINTRRASIFAKRLDGTETTVTGLNGATGERWVCAVFRPDVAWTSFTDHDTANNDGTTANPAAQTITAAGEATPVMAYGLMHSNAAVSPRTFSPMTEIASGSTTFYAHYLPYNSGDTPADITYDMDDEGTNFLQSGYLTFT